MPRIFWIFLILTLCLGGACSPGSYRSTIDASPDTSSLRWPPPPAATRIRFQKSISHPRDLGIRESVWGRMVSWMAGEQRLSFVRPTGVAADGETLFVADPGAQSLWIIDARRRRFQRVQMAEDTRFVSPVAVTVGPFNRVFLADSVLGIVFGIDPRDGSLAMQVEKDGLIRPTGVAYDGQRDRLYVADSAGHQIHVFNGEGEPLETIGRPGEKDGEFNRPTHVTLDGDGRLYVTDAMGFRIQIFTPNGGFIAQFGQHGDTAGSFASPKGVGVDSSGHIYVVEALFDAVQVFDQQGRHLLTFGERGVQPGEFWLPGGIFIDAQDRIFVADTYNQRVQVFQYVHNTIPE